jgi:hypothetical protein
VKLVLLFAVITTQTMAQTLWSSGVVVLEDKQVVKGEVQFQSDVLLFKAEAQTVVYPAHRISSFRFYDEKENINRHYLSLRDPRFVFPVTHFYEVVTWGDVSVVRRSNYPLLKNDKAHSEYDYFVLRENELTSLKKFRSHVYDELLERYPLTMKEYVSTQHLNPNQMADAIRIVKFYNQQVHARASIAAL